MCLYSHKCIESTPVVCNTLICLANAKYRIGTMPFLKVLSLQHFVYA